MAPCYGENVFGYKMACILMDNAIHCGHYDYNGKFVETCRFDENGISFLGEDGSWKDLNELFTEVFLKESDRIYTEEVMGEK